MGTKVKESTIIHRKTLNACLELEKHRSITTLQNATRLLKLHNFIDCNKCKDSEEKDKLIRAIRACAICGTKYHIFISDKNGEGFTVLE